MNVHFLLVGSTKSGTTSLFECFKRHPGIAVPKIKEPHYFSQGLFGVGYRGPGREITQSSDYDALFADAERGKIVADFDPLTLHGPRALELIQRSSPQAKIAAILRNPIERAYSHYRMDIKECIEDRPLLEAIERDWRKFQRGSREYCPLVRLGFYRRELEAFYAAFGRERVRVWLYEELLESPNRVVRELCGFIGLDPTGLPDVAKISENYSGAPRSVLSAYWLRSRMGSSQGPQDAYRLLPVGVRRIIRDQLIFKRVAFPPLPPRARQALIEIYAEDVRLLGKLLARNLDGWLVGETPRTLGGNREKLWSAALYYDKRTRPIVWRQAFGSARGFYGAKLLDFMRPFQRVAVNVLTRKTLAKPAEWRRGLILGSHHIGDVLWRTASLDQLKQALPECKWHYAVSSYAAAVLDGNPYVESTFDLYKVRGPLMAAASLKRIREMQFDVALCTNKYNYAADLVNAVLLSIPNRVSYVHKGMAHLCTHAIPIEFPQPYPGYFRDFVAYLTGTDGDWSLKPQVYPSAKHEQEANDFVAQTHLTRPYAVVFNTARTSNSVLTDEEIAGVVARLQTENKVSVLLAGGPDDRLALEKWAGMSGGRAAVCAGNISLLALACLLRNAEYVLTPDSGPRHLANAVGAPVVFLRALDNQNVTEIGPYCETEVDLFAGIDKDDAVALRQRRQPAEVLGALAAQYQRLSADRKMRV